MTTAEKQACVACEHDDAEKHYDGMGSYWYTNRCTAPALQKFEPVTGWYVPKCEDVRDGDTCPEFQQRKLKVRFWK